MRTIKLGSQVEDIVSGFEGIATARVEYLNGCIQYCVTPRSKDGSKSESIYFDHGQLIITGDGISVKKADTGGPSLYCPPV